jgi:uncharacterized repeat protein (TIGR01451 family)
MLSARSHRRAGTLVLAVRPAGVVVLALCLLGLLGGTAWGASEGVGWQVTSNALPTNLTPGHRGTIEVAVYNVGAADSTGTITVTDTLPAGVEAVEAGELIQEERPEEPAIGHERWGCSGSTVVTCTSIPAGLPSFAGGGGVPQRAGSAFGVSHLTPLIGIAVRVAPSAVEGPAVNRVSVAGGGAAGAASSSDPVRISSTPAGFGVAGWDAWFSNPDGTLDTQAGSHPYGATFDIALPTTLSDGRTVDIGGAVPAGGKEARDITVGLPPGVLADPGATPRCTRRQLELFSCPGDSQVGYMETSTAFRVATPLQVFNMVPPSGTPLELGFDVLGIITYLDAGVRSGGDYGATTRANNNLQGEVQNVRLTLWGVPGDPSHNPWRTRASEGCTEYDQPNAPPSICRLPERNPKAFLTLPVACEGPQTLSIAVNAWQDTELTGGTSIQTHDANGTPAGWEGCEHLSFHPSLGTALDTARADTPAGLTVDVRFPLEGFDEPGGLVPSDMKSATVTLPEGLVVNPGQANGLVACGETEASLHHKPSGEENDEAPSCPAASALGTARITSPLLEADLEKEVVGSVYLLQSNPPDLKLLVAGSADGVNVKSIGTVHLDESTGRLTAVFQNTPQLPVSDIKLAFNGGPQAAVLTPRACGVFTTTSDFAPWSTGVPDATPSALFALSEGAGGGACPNGEPFAPQANAGMVNNQAGGFSALSATFNRQDSEQDVSSVSVTTPPGLLAILKSVERCPEPQASLGACGAGSLIGHTTVGVGAGPDPLYVQGGQVFLTGPYKGAPFGLSIVVPAVAGPFNLGNVVVRAAINVDPHTAQATISSDPLPRILDGVPLQVKTVNVTIDRAGFMFNPTNCEPLAVTGALTSVHGATSAGSTRYQAANCANLPFKPTFMVSTQAKTSKSRGASLSVRYTSGAGQANTRAVDVTLPKQLPARLTTIQQACTEKAFAANPASCPAASVIGTAMATTPILASPATGPVYLVSHGGAAFPDVVAILQDEGVTVVLTGNVNIKKQITSASFDTVPDVPISTFQMVLPEGPHSGLAAVVPAQAKGSLCGQSLTMPTTLTGQNGAVVKQTTKIAVTGCPKAKKKAKPRHRGRRTRTTARTRKK